MGFSVKLAPGVRIRASSRGVRTSLGPRIARVHVGSGQTGFSTGLGPLSYYGSLGGSSRRRRPSPAGGSARISRELASARAAQARADKEAEAGRLQRALRAVEQIHHAEFQPAARPVAPLPPAPDRAGFLALYRARAKAEYTVLERADRAAALAEAERAATRSAQRQASRFEQERQEWQARLDAEWSALEANDVHTAMSHLVDAFADNEAAAAPVGVEGGDLSVVVLIPPTSVVPDRKPARTQAGNLSLKKLTKTEMADVYTTLVCGHLLVTVKEAFAVAPGITSVTAVALRPTPRDAYGAIGSEVIAAARFERARLRGVLWRQSRAIQIFNDVTSIRIFHQRGAARELTPVSLAAEPGLAAIVASVDFEDLMGG